MGSANGVCEGCKGVKLAVRAVRLHGARTFPGVTYGGREEEARRFSPVSVRLAQALRRSVPPYTGAPQQ